MLKTLCVILAGEVIWGSSVSAAQTSDVSNMVTSFAWIVLAVSALLVAVGALIVFTKLAKLIDRLETRLKRK